MTFSILLSVSIQEKAGVDAVDIIRHTDSWMYDKEF